MKLVIKVVYAIYDARYLTDEDTAICFDVCDTLKEVREVMNDYGNDVVIVKEMLKQTGKNKFESIKSEIVRGAK